MVFTQTIIQNNVDAVVFTQTIIQNNVDVLVFTQTIIQNNVDVLVFTQTIIQNNVDVLVFTQTIIQNILNHSDLTEIQMIVEFSWYSHKLSFKTMLMHLVLTIHSQSMEGIFIEMNFQNNVDVVVFTQTIIQNNVDKWYSHKLSFKTIFCH